MLLMKATITIKAANEEDTSDILNIQKSCYSDELVEDELVFFKVLRCKLSFIARNSVNEPIGYLLAHSIEDILVPPSLHDLSTLQFGSGTDYLYIHDLSVSPEYRGHGVGKDLVHHFLQYIAKEYEDVTYVSLVSINDISHSFWAQYGFAETSCDPAILNSYGQTNPQYMLLKL